MDTVLVYTYLTEMNKIEVRGYFVVQFIHILQSMSTQKTKC